MKQDTFFDSSIHYGVYSAGPLILHGKPHEVDLSTAFLSANRMSAISSTRRTAYSITLHAIVLAAILLIPIWFTGQLELSKYRQTMLVGPPPPAAPISSPVIVQKAQPAPRPSFVAKGKLLLPMSIPKQAAVIEEAPLPPALDIGELAAGGVAGGIPGASLEGGLAGVLGGIAPPPPPAVITPPPELVASKKPVRVGGDVQPPRAIFQPPPEYPPLARMARIWGDVVISAVIDTEGRVIEMKVVSGPSQLHSAALAALSKWLYEPTRLNGQPVSIEMNVTIHFRLAHMS
jgi:protein TonB